MKDWTARQAQAQGQTAIEMLSLHIGGLEHRLEETENSLRHALACNHRDCRRCMLLAKEVNRRQDGVL